MGSLLSKVTRARLPPIVGVNTSSWIDGPTPRASAQIDANSDTIVLLYTYVGAPIRSVSRLHRTPTNTSGPPWVLTNLYPPRNGSTSAAVC